jgi:hypothetical protein
LVLAAVGVFVGVNRLQRILEALKESNDVLSTFVKAASNGQITAEEMAEITREAKEAAAAWRAVAESAKGK